jgi:probable HAF family extracellular repeat protein
VRRPSLVLLVLLLVLAALAAPVGALPSAAPEYEVVDLGGLGGTASFALGLSDRGEAAGTARTGAGTRPQQAFAWRDGTVRPLEPLPGSTFSRAFAVNPRGEAVGEAFTPSPERSRAVRWDRDGRITDLGTLEGASGAVANDLNARGQVVGSSGGQAVVWDGAAPQPVGTLGGEGSTARGNAINDRGQVVGSSQTDVRSASGSRVSHAFLATPIGRGYRLTDLGSLGGPAAFSVAYGLSNRGDVVGESVTEAGGSTYRATLWRDGRVVDLGTLPGLRHSRANDVSADGTVVGHASGFYGFPTIDGAAVRWRGGDVVDLNALIPADAGWVLRSAEAINAAGEIVGFGTHEGETRAFLLRPVRP